MKQQQRHQPPSASWWSSDPAARNGQPSHHARLPMLLLPTPPRKRALKSPPLLSERMRRSTKGRAGPTVEGPDPTRRRPTQAPLEGAMVARKHKVQDAKQKKHERVGSARSGRVSCGSTNYPSAHSAAAGTEAFRSPCLLLRWGRRKKIGGSLWGEGPAAAFLVLGRTSAWRALQQR